ncbi:hypothetical protein PV-S19_0340 [Pacmanvirus S19]|nr:hypothetical protein PV-S19_0340 [Pacmanvirus S19]
MEKIANMLEARLEQVKIISDNASKYIDMIKNIINSMNPDEYKKAISAIELINDAVQNLPKYKPQANNVIQSAFELYQQFISVDSSIMLLLSIFENSTYTKLALYNMSATYAMNILHDKNIVITAYEKYQDISITDDEIIFEMIFEKAKISDKPEQYIPWIIENKKNVNKFTIRFISKIINLLSGEFRRRLELIIEEQKDISLGSYRLNLSKYTGIQEILVRYNLSPATNSMNISKIFETLELNYDEDSTFEENIKNITDTGIGVIIVNKSNNSPVEFDLRGLINLDYIIQNELKTNPQSGLTKKILQRYATVNKLKSSGLAKSLLKFPSKNGQKWYILETIDDTTYRFLGRNGEKIVTSDTIQGILLGITTRAHHYNLMQTNDILDRCFDPKAQLILLAYEEEKLSLPSSEPIRNEIAEKLIKWFEAAKGKISSVREMKEIVINRKVINEILLDTLTHSIGIHGKGSDEYMITYIAKFDTIINKFIKELEKRWQEEKISDRIFKEHSEKELHQVIMDIFANVTRGAINELDNDKTWTEYDITLKEFFLERKQAIV